MSVENAPTTNAHTDTHFTPVAMHTGKNQTSEVGERKKNTLKTDIETSRQKQTPTIQFCSVSANSRIDVIPQRCLIMKYLVRPLTCVAIKRTFITLILTDMAPSDYFMCSAETHSYFCANCVDMILKIVGFSFISQKVNFITRSCSSMCVDIPINKELNTQALLLL